MGWNLYSIYAYAVNVQDLPLRDKIKTLLNDEDEERYQDVEDVLEDLRDGCLDDPVFKKLKNVRWEIIYGPDGLYIGYYANMPYEKPLMTKEEMDKEIYNTLAYLCGKEVAKNNIPEKIYKIWNE